MAVFKNIQYWILKKQPNYVFLLSGFCFILPMFTHILFATLFGYTWFLMLIITSITFTLLFYDWASLFHKEIYLICLALGEIFFYGIFLFFADLEGLRPFGSYLALLSFFHFSEFFITAIIKPHKLNHDAFLLNNGSSYWNALAVSWIEYFALLYFFPISKHLYPICWFGIILSIIGELLRKGAMITANENFDHIIQTTKKPNHRLVTHGIYSLFRHPSYVGWFCWAIGTQLVLMNPICLVAYTVVTWHFFNQRIMSEEIFLLNFFGQAYIDYQKHVPTGIPFISGYIIGEQLKKNSLSKKDH